MTSSNSGIIELFYDRAGKEKELLVSITNPIIFSVELRAADSNLIIGNATETIWTAFKCWIPVIKQLGAACLTLLLPIESASRTNRRFI